jgi:type IV pilus assembly protein PilX
MKTRIRPLRGRERGYMILLVLVALVAMSLSGIALIRSMDTNQLVAGNMAARNATIHSADIGVQTAVAWIQAQGAANNGALNNDNVGAGYYSEDQEPNWTLASTWNGCGNCSVQDGAGNTVNYLIHRMCAITGSTNAVGQFCAAQTGGAVGTGGSASSDGFDFKGSPKNFYRISIQVVGPRNTTTLSQAFVVL